MAASRMQRWALLLSGYNFDIKHIKGVDNKQADYLSRVYRECKGEGDDNGDDYPYLNFVMERIITLHKNKIVNAYECDEVLKTVKKYTEVEWPNISSEELHAYKAIARELTVEQGYLMWGHRVIIPMKLRNVIMAELHAAHQGIVQMESLARSYVWWPGIDSDLEKYAKSCRVCLENADNPPRATLHSWEWPKGPNQRLHVDFLGPLEGMMYMIVVDAYSKWVDVRKMKQITTEAAIEMLKTYFATWGLPSVLMSDNGPAFSAKGFKCFMDEYEIKHITSAPYHPASNGAAGNAVRSFKRKYKVLRASGCLVDDAINKYLFYARASVHAITNCSPAQLQIGRVFRTKLDLLRPTVVRTVLKKQKVQCDNFRGNRKTDFSVNDPVMTKDYMSGKWIYGIVIERLRSVIYRIRLDDHRVWKRHVDQLNTCNDRKNDSVVIPSSNIPLRSDIVERWALAGNSADDYVSHNENAPVRKELCNDAIIKKSVTPPVMESVEKSISPVMITELRRSKRQVKPPVRLNL